VWNVDTSREPKFTQGTGQFSLKSLFVAITIIALLCGLFLVALPGVITTRPISNKINCQSNLRQIGIALTAYHVTHGSYPPLVTKDASGRPFHSWRTHLLLHIERDDLAERYDWSEPWNGPTNSTLHAERIKLFRCPSERSTPVGQISYLAIEIPGYKPGDRFAVIECPQSGINFFEPRDLALDDVPKSGPLAAHHGDSVHVLWTDGTVESVKVKDLAARLREKLVR